MCDALTMATSVPGGSGGGYGGGGGAAGGGYGYRGGGGGGSRAASIPRSESFSTTDPSKLSDSELDCLKEVRLIAMAKSRPRRYPEKIPMQ